MSYVPVDIYVKDTSPSALPIEAVVVMAFDSTGSQAIAQAVTDAAGHAGFLLPDLTTYQLRFFKQNVQFSNPQYAAILSLPGVNKFDVTGSLFIPPAAKDPRLCRASGFFRTVTGAPALGVHMDFIAKFNPVLLEGAAVLTEREDATTDDNGYIEIDLIRFGQYDVNVAGIMDTLRTISVPDAPSVNLPDLLFPVVASVALDPPGPYELTLGGDELTLTPTVTASDGNVLDGAATGSVLWKSSDPSILAVAAMPTAVVLRAVAAGSAQVTATRQDGSVIRIPNTPITGQPIDVTVT